jgi:hypothetical protein
MLIIGGDFHTRFQQIAMVDTETGDMVDRKFISRDETTLASARNAGGTRYRAYSLLPTSAMIHAQCSPTMHPQSTWVSKWEPVVRKV